MSDRDNELLQMGNDLELITSYLNGHLDPERLQQVRRRLDDDPAFRDLAAPMLLTWSVPKHLERHPRPAGELEKHWDEFTKRAGFAHQRRRARVRWLRLLGVLAIVGAGSFIALKNRVRAWYDDLRNYHSVAYAPGWVEIGDGRDAQLAKGARLRVANKLTDGSLWVRLVGTARFRTRVVDTTGLLPEMHFIIVETRAGRAGGGNGEFTVSAIADTLAVENHHPSKRQFVGFMPIPTTVFLTGIEDEEHNLTLREDQRARVVRGARPVRLP